ncbi:MAG TPA: hypothetical protein VK541_11650 [Pedobacter sp.]|uniref:hypothetical protein n=1 Tax=Pedobacter sp. TaxID=1411316 RepID=UPI002C4F4D30|nr:hypothetical protein [Pedobacter sp.]HMI03131.1 hypothetical protein [Pedobacter sp.]
MRHNLLFIFFILTLLVVACKKDKQNIPTEEPEKPIELPFYKDLQIDSIEQLSIVVSFQLNKTAKVTGMLTALDSTQLAGAYQDYMERKVILRNGRYYAKIEWPYNLPPSDDLIWFRLYMVDEDGVKSYSPILRQKIATYQIKNKYIVNGKAAYNNHPKDFFMNYEGGVIGTYDNSLIIDAVTNDVNVENYRATLNDIPVSVGRIDPVYHPETHKHILFDVPDDFPLGRATLKFYYLNKLEYTVDLTVVNGGLLNAVKHPVARTTGGCFFEYNGKLFTYINYGSDGVYFYSWDPETNVWQNLPVPEEIARHIYNTTSPAKVINGIVYFKPVMHAYGGPYAEIPRTYDELIISYDPRTGQAKNTRLFHTTNSSEERALKVMDYFVYGDKLYCLTAESLNGETTSSAYRVRVYNPADESWTHYMDLPFKGIWTSVVNNGQVFLMNSDYGKQESATANFVNEFYLFNVSGKALVKRNWITDREVGAGDSYLTSFNNKIYIYGGNYSDGYASNYSSLFAVYDPQQDKWSPVSGYSYFTAWVSQNYGFMFPIRNKLYLGLGRDRSTNGNIHGSKSNYSIHQVAIK